MIDTSEIDTSNIEYILKQLNVAWKNKDSFSIQILVSRLERLGYKVEPIYSN